MTMNTDDQAQTPDALFSALVWRLAVETRAFLGEELHPEIERVEPRLDYAAHTIDTLQMLKDRTEGRRSADETEMLESILCQLRMDYIAARRRLEGEPVAPACDPEAPAPTNPPQPEPTGASE